jgi:hypothetical protein
MAFDQDELLIDIVPKIGLSGVDLDPWTRRRLHNGSLVERGGGEANRDFELYTWSGGRIHRLRRDNSVEGRQQGFPWYAEQSVAAPDAATVPSVTVSTIDRNAEVVYLRRADQGGRLRLRSFSPATLTWSGGELFGPANAAGIPGFIQSNHGAPGDYEVVVRRSDGQLSHWTRQNSPCGVHTVGEWYERATFAADVAHSGPTLVQSHFGTTGLPVGGGPLEAGRGDLEVVFANTLGELEHWRWPTGGAGWIVSPHQPRFGTLVKSPPCMIEGQYHCPDERSVGDFELCVAVAGDVQHWRRSNLGGLPTAGLGPSLGGDWTQLKSFGIGNARSVVALIESSFTFRLEAIVLRTDNWLQHFWFDRDGWHDGGIIHPKKEVRGLMVTSRQVLAAAAMLVFINNIINRSRGIERGPIALNSIGLALLSAAMLAPERDIKLW